jgi:hypothetical protein
MKSLFTLVLGLWLSSSVAQQTLQISYTSKLPFTTGLEDQNLGLKKELLAVQITTTLIRNYLALLGAQPGFEEDVLFEVQLVHPDAPGTQHHVRGAIKKTYIAPLQASEERFNDTINTLFYNTLAWILRLM